MRQAKSMLKAANKITSGIKLLRKIETSQATNLAMTHLFQHCMKAVKRSKKQDEA